MASDPAIDYTGRDFTAVKQNLLSYAAKVAPNWTSRSEGSLDMATVELFSYMADVMSYYADRVQMESYIGTATQRLSLLYIAQLLGYIPHGPIPSTGTVTVITNNPGPAVSIPAGTQFSTDFIPSIDAPLIFETTTTTTVAANGGTAALAVIQGQTLTQVTIAVSSGQPQQIYQLPNTSVIDGTVQVFVATATTPAQWAYIPFLVDAQATDMVYTTFTDANGSTWIKFGDGINGMIPPISMTIYATYRIGGGQVGNLPAGAITTFTSNAISGVAIQQDNTGKFISSAMVGGADAESNDSIRNNAPLAFRTQQRAVTVSDFQNLALSVPGVTKASAVATHYTNVTLYITGPGGTSPTQTLRNSVSTFFSTRTLAGVSLTVSAATLVPVNFGASGNACQLFVLDRYSQANVLSAVTTALQNYMSISNMNFGQRISLSQVYYALQGIPGVAYLYISMMARNDAAQSGTADVLCRLNEIPTAGNIVITATGGV